MSKEKQIEEMARFCCTTCEMFTNNPVGANKSPCALDNDYNSCPLCIEAAERLYNAGYRKQSEVIEEYRKKVYSKMEKYTVFGREYIQRIMREVEKEMKGGAE